MGHTLTIRLPKSLATWIEDASARSGISQGELVRQHLERARSQDVASKKFMRLAGVIRGPRDLSTRKGFSKE
jgi:Arc/MetJ-type ribon-helix-helix transcriptional regulator